jgi:AcrR family transcriptional regulator
VARTVGSVADDTRQRILDIAVDLFIDQGYAGTSVRDISERLGMTKGSLYYHFASKEDVLDALVTPMLDDLDLFMSDARAADAIDHQLVYRLVNLLDRHGVLLRSLMGDPSVLHGLALRRSMPQRIAALQRSLANSDDPAAILRARCALGVINAGAIAPRFESIPPGGIRPRDAAARVRLTEKEKQFVVTAAMAVLSVPA